MGGWHFKEKKSLKGLLWKVIMKSRLRNTVLILFSFTCSLNFIWMNFVLTSEAHILYKWTLCKSCACVRYVDFDFGVHACVQPFLFLATSPLWGHASKWLFGLFSEFFFFFFCCKHSLTWVPRHVCLHFFWVYSWRRGILDHRKAPLLDIHPH